MDRILYYNTVHRFSTIPVDNISTGRWVGFTDVIIDARWVIEIPNNSVGQFRIFDLISDEWLSGRCARIRVWRTTRTDDISIIIITSAIQMSSYFKLVT